MNRITKYRKTPAATAAIAAMIFGSLVHLFGLTNVLHNGDNIVMQPQSVGVTLPSGRWFLFVLDYLGEVTFGNFNLPLVNGLVFLLLLSISVAFLVSVLKIQNKTYAVLIGLGLVSFPSITVTLFFKFTAPHYGLAILLSVLAVWVMEKWRYGFLLAVCFIAMSLGIYQAYFPVTVTLCLLLLIKLALERETRPLAVIRRGFLYLGAMIGGLVAYFLVLKIMLRIENVTLLGYQGISSMGKLTISQLPKLLWRTVRDFMLLPIEDYCALATSPLLKLGYLLLGLISIMIVVLLIVKTKKKLLGILVICGLCILFPIGVNLIVIMGATRIYTLMVLSFALILCAPLVLLELLHRENVVSIKINKCASTCVVGIITVIVLLNSYFANVNYTSMYYSNRQVENFYNSLTTQIHMTEGYDTTKTWAFIGKVNEKFFNQSRWSGKHNYDTNSSSVGLIKQYSTKSWSMYYLGYRYPSASEKEIERLKRLPEVQEMPCWPDEGSVKVIDEYVVVKFED